MKHCTRCLYVDTKPDLILDDEGVCSACRHYEARQRIDWAQREQDFRDLACRYKAFGNYDCIVPVSGGKDSHYQIIKCLEYGLNPLAVTATTDSLSGIGRRNLDNLQRLGVDHIEVTTNPNVRRRINKFTLQTVGDISWAEHATIFTIPVRLACQMGIKLIVWGENPQNEYGGPNADSNVLSARWLAEFGGLLGLRVSDMVGIEGIGKRDLIQYTYPSDGELERVGVTGIFLGHYFPWDGYHNAVKAMEHGFEPWKTSVEGSCAAYENLDNHQTGIHDYFKFLKFGFGRATDIASNHIRRGRASRKEALEQVRRFDGEYPSTYLDKPLAEILAEIDMTEAELEDCVRRFTNTKLFDTSVYPPRLKDRHECTSSWSDTAVQEQASSTP